MRRKLIGAGLILFTTASGMAPAVNAMYEKTAQEVKPTVHVGRYSTLVAEATPGQRDLLQAIIQTRFHQRITTVGEAMQYLLLRSGYRLADKASAGEAMQILLSRPLPEVHRHLGPMTLEEALLTLAGPVYSLVIDPLNRLLAFEVVDKYRPLVTGRPIDEEEQNNTEQGEENASSYSHSEEASHTNHKARDKAYAYRKQHNTTQSQVEAYETDEAEAMKAYGGEQSAETGVFGPVSSTDTSFGIARELAKERGVSTSRMLFAIVQGNPSAFGKVAGEPNINLLYQDVFIDVPSEEELMQVNEQDALNMISDHNLAWRGY